MLSPSDIVVRPTNLTDRLAAQGSGGMPANPEPTPTTMAERFAPEAQRVADDAAALPVSDPQAVPGLIAERARARVSSAGQGLLIAAILVSLIPTAAILALLWQGVITVPGQSDAQKFTGRAPLGATEHAAIAPPPVLPAPVVQATPKPEPVVAPEPEPVVAPEAEVALTAPGQIAAKSGEDVPFAIAIDSADGLPARSVIAIRALPEGATFSQGRPYGSTEWNLTPDEIGELKLRLPETVSGPTELRVELMAADGTVLANATTRLDILPDAKSALILRSDEQGRVAGLIALGHKMIDVGYFAGARAYFKRAAEAGSGDAALLLGATFDAEFIDKIGAQGIKADPEEAQDWYERAKKLGVEDVETKLKALKEDMTSSPVPVQATEAPAEPVAPAPAPAETQPAATAKQAAQVEEEDPPPGTVETSLPAGSDEWVEITSYANVRAAPSSTAGTLRVAEKGSKLRVTGRAGNWVQVTDPVTSEVGWVYGRYIQTAQAPAR
jgi:Bacterial SH3 domain